MTGFESKRASARDKLSDEELFHGVIEQLGSDIAWEDFTAIEELLKFVPRENLIAYLKEEKQ
jgi:hypothetical protein